MLQGSKPSCFWCWVNWRCEFNVKECLHYADIEPENDEEVQYSLALIVWTRVTRSILVVSPMNTVPTVMTLRSLVPHILNPVKAPRSRRLPTLLNPSLTCWAFIARNLHPMLVVYDQEDEYRAIETWKTFYDAVPYDPDDGGRKW